MNFIKPLNSERRTGKDGSGSRILRSAFMEKILIYGRFYDAIIQRDEAGFETG
jgi:hypothetical protein